MLQYPTATVLPVTTWTVCRTRMKSAERAAKLADFHVTNAANLCHRVKGGGCDMLKSSNAAKPLSSICLNRLWLAVLKRPSRCGRGRKAGT